MTIRTTVRRACRPTPVSDQVAPRTMDRSAWLQSFEVALYEDARTRGVRRGAGQYDQARPVRSISYDVFAR